MVKIWAKNEVENLHEIQKSSFPDELLRDRSCDAWGRDLRWDELVCAYRKYRDWWEKTYGGVKVKRDPAYFVVRWVGGKWGWYEMLYGFDEGGKEFAVPWSRRRQK